MPYTVECYDMENDDYETLTGPDGRVRAYDTVEAGKAAAQQHWDECRRTTDDEPEQLNWQDMAHDGEEECWCGTDSAQCEVQYCLESIESA